MHSNIFWTYAALIALIANVVHGQRGVPGDYTLISSVPELAFCTKNLRVIGVRNFIERLAFNGNDTVCAGSLTLVLRRRRNDTRDRDRDREDGVGNGNSNRNSTSTKTRPDRVRLRSMERFKCAGMVDEFRLRYTRYARSHTTSLYRKVIELRQGGRGGPTCVYARGRQEIPNELASPTPRPTRTPAPSARPATVSPLTIAPTPRASAAAPVNAQASRRGFLGRGLSIAAAVLAAIALTITVGCCWAARQPIYMPICGFTATSGRIWLGTVATGLFTVAAICTGILA